MKRIRPAAPVDPAVRDAEARSRRTLSPAQFGFQTGGAGPSKFDPATTRTHVLQPHTSLRTTQTGISELDVDKYAADPKALSYNPLSRRPHLIEHNGELWVHDGHHRLAAARRQGRPIRVDVSRSVAETN